MYRVAVNSPAIFLSILHSYLFFCFGATVFFCGVCADGFGLPDGFTGFTGGFDFDTGFVGDDLLTGTGFFTGCFTVTDGFIVGCTFVADGFNVGGTFADDGFIVGTVLADDGFIVGAVLAVGGFV
jgi:hypothetical protein